MYIKYCIFVFLCMFSTVVFSAQDNIDKHKTFTNSEEIDNFLIATEDIRSTDFQLFSENLQNLKASQNIFSPFQQCYYSYLLAYKLGLSGKFNHATTQLLELFDQCESLKIKIRLKGLLSNLYVISGNYHQGISSLDYVISNIDEINDKTTKHIAYTGAFIVYELVSQPELSKKFAQLLINDNPSNKYLCKGQVYKYMAILKLNYQGSLDNEIENVIEKCIKTGEELYGQLLNIVLVNYRFKKANTKEQINKLYKKLLESENDIEAIKYRNLIGIKNTLLSQMHDKLGRSSQALKYADLAIENSASIGTTEHKIDALQVLINHYQNALDYKSANQYLLEKNKAEKKLYSDKQAKLMAYQTVKHDNLAKTHQITSLNQRNDLLSLENKLAEESKNSQRLINILLGILLLFFLFFNL